MNWLACLAMALDTLPLEGRVLLLAIGLAVALYLLSKRLPPDSVGLNVLYRKGVLLTLLCVPIAVYWFEVKVPVRVDEWAAWTTPVPGYFAWSVLFIWLIGTCHQAYKLLTGLHQLRLNSLTQCRPAAEFAPALVERVQHWAQRLSIHSDVVLYVGGAQPAWHMEDCSAWFSGRRRILLFVPAATLNWPSGVFDTQLLMQLAQVNQSSWRWLLFGRFIQTLYWPLPIVGALVDELAAMLDIPAQSLAAAAYRDPDGWRRDRRQLDNRVSSLTSTTANQSGNPAPQFIVPATQSNDGSDSQKRDSADAADFQNRWVQTKVAKRARARDPHEQVYWLIAVACLVVGLSTTLTLSPKPPEFEPQFLKIKWQDQMAPRFRQLGD